MLQFKIDYTAIRRLTVGLENDLILLDSNIGLL